ncbi:MAG TPA: glycosyl hydrolase family 28-related protein, partial [Bacilli bacterium]
MKEKANRKWYRHALGFLAVSCLFLLFSLPAMSTSHPVVNVGDHGAVPNDGGDDGAAIRKAIGTAVASGSGTEVIFSPGTYHVSPPPSAWEFNTDGNFEGWTLTNQVVGVVSGGNLALTVSGTNPYIHSPNYLNMDPDKFKFLKI